MTDLSVGRIFGIPLRLEGTALLFLGLIALGSARSGALAMAEGVAYAAVVFGSVLVHELGHALVARRTGVGALEIVLHGFGGLTRFGRTPGPREGVFITLAGPLAGIALGVAAWPLSLAFRSSELLAKVVTFNIGWSLFNLVPMYPLDGGHVLYHLLAHVQGQRAALRVTAWVGLAAAVLVGLAGYAVGMFFVMIVAGLSVWQCVRILQQTGRS